MATRQGASKRGSVERSRFNRHAARAGYQRWAKGRLAIGIPVLQKSSSNDLTPGGVKSIERRLRRASVNTTPRTARNCLAKSRKWELANRKKVLRKKRIYRQKNRKKIRKATRGARLRRTPQQRAKDRAKVRKWKAANANRYRKSRATYRARNREKTRKANRIYARKQRAKKRPKLIG